MVLAREDVGRFEKPVLLNPCEKPLFPETISKKAKKMI